MSTAPAVIILKLLRSVAYPLDVSQNLAPHGQGQDDRRPEH
ncbi:MAG TPA: hypothetical protein VE842_13425 [Pyrinomonadaceae bacterium]|nr:hypothetical protein [Pyrinomonadaceae bacterium]